MSSIHELNKKMKRFSPRRLNLQLIHVSEAHPLEILKRNSLDIYRREKEEKEWFLIE